MKSTNTEYDEIMRRRIREPINVLIEIRNGVSPKGDTSLNRRPYTVSNSSDERYFYKLANGFDYASLEQNHIVLDTDQYFFPKTDPQGYTIKSSMGVYPENLLSNMTLTISNFFGNKIGFTVWFDIYSGEWPYSFDISYATASGRITKKIYPTGPKVFVRVDQGEATGGNVVLSNFMNSRPGTPTETHALRMTLLIEGGFELFDSVSVVQCDQMNDVDPISRRMPRQHFKFSVLDLENRYSFGYEGSMWPVLSDNAIATVKYVMPSPEKDGPIAEVFGGSYPMDKCPVHSGIITTYHCKSTLETTMWNKYDREPTPRDPPYVQTLREKVDGLRGYQGDFQFPDEGGGKREIAESLSQIQTYPRLPHKSYSECLQIVANAGCCSLCTVNGHLKIKSLNMSVPAEQGFHLTYDQILKNGIKLQHSPRLKAIEVCINNDQITDEVGQSVSVRRIETAPVYTDSLIIEKGSYTFLKIAENSPAGATMNGVYRDVAYIQVPSSQFGKKVFIEESGPYRESKDVIREQFFYNSDGTEERVDNPLVVSSESAQRVMKTLKEYYSLTDTYTIKYRGNPELEPGDRIWVSISETEKIPVLILKTRINYKGSITGEIVVKRLKEV